MLFKRYHRASLSARGIKVALLLTSASYSAAGWAQTDYDTPPPSMRSLPDEHGVDRATGTFKFAVHAVSIGNPKNGGLEYIMYGPALGSEYNYHIWAQANTSGATVYFGDRQATFSNSGGTFTSTQGTGETFSVSSTGYTYKATDGTTIAFDRTLDTDPGVYSDIGYASTISYPNGSRTVLTYQKMGWVSRGTDVFWEVRLKSINNSSGYQIKLEYDQNTISGHNDVLAWHDLSKVTGINNAIEYCSPTSDACSLSHAWPSITFAAQGIVDQLGNVTQYTSNGTFISGIKYPGSTSDDVSIQYDANGRVSSITDHGVTTTYTWSLNGSVLTGTSTDPVGHTHVTTADISQDVILTDQDELSHTTTYLYEDGRLSDVVSPEGAISNGQAVSGYTHYEYDDNGNITETRMVSKTPGTPADVITTALYPENCANAPNCDKPIWIKDAKGNETDYTFDGATGNPLVVKAPAATADAPRHITTYGYTNYQAYYYDGSGSIVASGLSTPLLTSVSTCQTQEVCAGTADEVKTTISYGPQTSGVGNNLLPVSTSKGSGDNTLTATSAVTYDELGDVVTVDGPLSGPDDTTRYRYDGARRLTGVVSADPDGGGPLLNRAQRITYRPDGLVSSIEVGTVTSQSDSDWVNFNPLQEVDKSYDTNHRLTKVSLGSGGSTASVTQYSYDSLGRMDCAAVRMNAAVFGSLPAACSLSTTGSDGSDRITKYGYDDTSRLASVTTGYLTGDQAVVANTYTPDGKLESVKDGQNNLTTYVYDGLDRLWQTRYPIGTQGANTSSTTDYEQLVYDLNGNVTQRRLRDGQMITYGYDNLNQLASEDRPNVAYSETDKGYGYDLLGRLTSATDSNTRYLGFSYDALGRKVGQTDNSYAFGNATMKYDAAGRRTRLTWQDGRYVMYDYDTLGDMTAIRENGATSGIGVLATFAYDNLGQRKTLTRGNGTVTTYGYDSFSRLNALTEDLAGTAYDDTLTFGYNAADQITSRTRSNNVYAWNGQFNVDRTYTNNGLNQLTATQTPDGSTALGYDTRGNLTSSGSDTYTYTSENELATGPEASLAYDPLGWLYNIAPASGVSTTLLSDDNKVLAEVDNSSGTLLRRYVYGPNVDEPVLWYEGAGTSDRRWLHADERGSVVAVSDASGNALGINSYDEYGIPASSNGGVGALTGRFGYTGQAWIPQLHMWYYKARMYSATLGRFMQTDPTGYADGPNWYGYVSNDPINLSDPTGLGSEDCQGTRGIGCGTGGSGGGGVVVTSLCPGSPAFLFSDGGICYYGGAGGGRGLTAGSSDNGGRVGGTDNRGTPPTCGRGAASGPCGARQKTLPPCAQKFLSSRVSGDPSKITLHDGGALPNVFHNSVTYGSDVYLTDNVYDEHSAGAMINKFHEIGHTSQNARLGLNAFDHFGAYLMFGGHDASPLERGADDFAQATYDAYVKQGLDKTCPF